MKRRYRYDKSQGRVVEVFAGDRPRAHEVMRDCYSSNPVLSPVDGTLLDSRAKLRDHNARNGVVDVGNDPAFNEPARQGKAYKPDRHAIIEDAKRAMAQHGWGD